MPRARYALIGLLVIALLVSCAQMEKARIPPGGMAAAIPDTPEQASPKARAAGAPAASGLRTGFADDNRQFNYFLQFLEKHGAQVAHLPIPVDERILLRAADSEGKPLVNAAVEVYSDSGRLLCTGLTYSDGSFMFFPEEYGPSYSYRAVVTVNQVPREVQFQREGPREVSVFPQPQVRPADPELKLPAEYFTEQLMLSFSRSDEVRKTFRILERKDLQKVLEELGLELAGLADEKQAARVGKLIGAQVLVIGKLYAKGGDYELTLKLLRVETGEVLSVAKAVIDRKLGLGG